ncbi:hypothetical protein F0562_005470 [Nyssa sinensis]|uniref:Uncharacterized protein n=1 Tax=Nyssa sinensis TaxID=561372 RepID=A0A5J5ALX8_9ASTE|nr:hypothetical protein F0562_005470 [Nyssa sinensis]
MVAAPTGTWDTEWHADTSATYHVTNDLNNLNLRNDDYQGTDQVQVGNGQGPASVVSTNGAKYYVSFLDDYSKFVCTRPNTTNPKPV